MVWNILMVLFFLTVPAGVMWLCRRVSVLGKIGPVLILYLCTQRFIVSGIMSGAVKG